MPSGVKLFPGLVNTEVSPISGHVPRHVIGVRDALLAIQRERWMIGSDDCPPLQKLFHKPLLLLPPRAHLIRGFQRVGAGDGRCNPLLVIKLEFERELGAGLDVDKFYSTAQRRIHPIDNTPHVPCG